MTEQFEYAKPLMVESIEDCDFYHSMHVPGVGEVSGKWDLRAVVDDYLGGVDFSGKRVLDMGTASGFLSFEMEKRGAEVVSFDLDDAACFEFVPHFKQQHNLGKIVNANRRDLQRLKNSYWLAHRAFQSSARVYYGNIYDLPDGLGRFDIVVFGMILSHLRDPFQALYSGSRLSTRLLIITNQTMKMEEPFACFMPDPDDKSLITAWWAFSDGCIKRMLGVLGFRVTHTVMSRPECLIRNREGHELCTAFVGERMSTGLIDALTSWLGRKSVSKRKAAEEWAEREAFRPSVARAMCRASWRSLWRNVLEGGAWSMVAAQAKAMLRLLPVALLGPRWRLLGFRWSLWMAMARCWLWCFNEEKSYRAYCDAYDRIIRYSRLEFIAEQLAATAPAPPEACEYRPSEMQDEWLVGFHAVERLREDSFRWSGSVSLVRLRVPVGAYDVQIETRTLRQAPVPLCLGVFFNRHQVPRFSLQWQDGTLSFRIQPSMFEQGPEQRLILTCNPVRPWKVGVPDRRELGLPIFSIAFRPLGPAAGDRADPASLLQAPMRYSA